MIIKYLNHLSNYKYFNKKDNIEISVSPNQEERILLGWGNFSDNSISEYVKTIDFIEIVSINDKKQLKGKQELFTFFKTHRKGLLKNEIRIFIVR